MRRKGKRRVKKGEGEEKGKKNRGLVCQKGKWKAKKGDFVEKVLGSFPYWAWKGFHGTIYIHEIM